MNGCEVISSIILFLNKCNVVAHLVPSDALSQILAIPHWVQTAREQCMKLAGHMLVLYGECLYIHVRHTATLVTEK